MNIKKNNFLKDYPAESYGLLDAFNKIGKHIFQSSWTGNEWQFTFGNYLDPKEASLRLEDYLRDSCKSAEEWSNSQESRKKAIDWITRQNIYKILQEKKWDWDAASAEARKIIITQREIDNWIKYEREKFLEAVYFSKINLGQNPNSLADFKDLKGAIKDDKSYKELYKKSCMHGTASEQLRKIIRDGYVEAKIHDKLNKHLPQKVLIPETIDGFRLNYAYDSLTCLGGSGNYTLKIPREQLDYVLKSGNKFSNKKNFGKIGDVKQADMQKKNGSPSRFTKMIKSLKAKPEYDSLEKLWNFIYSEASKGSSGNQAFRDDYGFSEFEKKQNTQQQEIYFKTVESKKKSNRRTMTKKSFRAAYKNT